MSWLDAWRAFIKAGRPAPDTYTQATSCKTLQLPVPRQSAGALPGNLKRLLAERGLSVEVLAGKAHISASNIRHLLRGTGYDRGTPEASPNPTLTTLLAVAQAMGVGIGDLVEERES